MKQHLLLGAALLALAVPAAAQEAPQAYPESSGLDTSVDDAVETAPVAAAGTSTGNPVLDRLNALEARIRQLEARNAELEAQQGETATRVQKVEVRAATAVQPGPAPTFADVGGKFSFKPRGVIQLDYASFNERAGGYDYSNGTDIRRARLGFDGTAFSKFKYRVEAELVKKQVTLLDAYLQYVVNPKLTLTVGQHKAPAGLEANSSDTFNSFLERGMATNAFGAIGADRRVGASLAYASDHVYAQAGLFGAPEDFTRSKRVDETYGVNGRLVWEPVVDDGLLVHFGVSGWQATNLEGSITLSDRPNVRADDGKLVSATITNAKDATFLGAEAALVKGPFSLQGEYGRLSVDRSDMNPTVHFDGFNVFGSWVLTGETRPFKGGVADRLKPFADFDPAAGTWGAVELMVRYDQLDLTDHDLSPLGRKASSWTGGINWHLNPNTRLILNYIRFKGEDSPLKATGAPAGTLAKGDALATRLQLDF